MNVLIYTRVAPNNYKVHRCDRLQAQNQRCRDFASGSGLVVLRTYSDQGEMRLPHLLPGIQNLLDRLFREELATLVLADHPGRLGLQDNIRQTVLKYIEKAGGSFISVYCHTAEKMGR